MYTTKSSVIVVLLCSISVKIRADIDTEGYYWRDYNGGTVPKDAYPGGTNTNGNPTYIGQVVHNNLVIPAEIDPEQKKATYEWSYKEFVTNENIKIFCTKHPEKFEWLQTGSRLIDNINPETLVTGGFEPGTKTYIGRKQIDDRVVLGKITKSSTWTTLKTTKYGIGTQHADFDVLSYNTNKTDHLQQDTDTRIDENKNSATTCGKRILVINFYS